jgi:uncharacterized membrane protein
MPPGWIDSIAEAINDDGMVAGWGSNNGGFIYNDGEYTELLPPGDLYVGGVVDINNDGAVLGYGGNNEKSSHFIYKDGEYTELPKQGWESGLASAFNDDGAVVGYLAAGHDGFVYKDGAVTELKPPGFGDSYCRAINNEGMVAGYVETVIDPHFSAITIRPPHGFIATPVTN